MSLVFKCKTCEQEKPATAFSVHKQCRVGYDLSRCKECKKSYSLAANKWASRTIEQKILNRAKTRATAKGIPFDIDIEDIIIPDVCPVFGKPFIYGDHAWTYSIDRIKPELGYVKGNIMIISNKANMMKNDATTEEIGMLYAFLCEISF